MAFFFFFFFNDEKRIGFKKLSRADLGISNSSNQTHIGLYEGVLEFLEDTDVVKSAMLIYDDYCDILNCSFDRIKTPEGRYRSPKIRIGSDASSSIVNKIREFAKEGNEKPAIVTIENIDVDYLSFEDGKPIEKDNFAEWLEPRRKRQLKFRYTKPLELSECKVELYNKELYLKIKEEEK